MTFADDRARSTFVRAGTTGWRHVLTRLLLVIGASMLLGAATSFAQTSLPGVLQPFANSASGWTLLTAVMVAALRTRTRLAALLGAVSFVGLVLGYQVTSTLRSFPTTETLFLIIGVVVGPFVGVAAAWLSRGGVRAALGCAALSGIAIGEGTYGLIVIAASTGWLYWSLMGAAGCTLLVIMLVRGVRAARDRLLMVGSTAAVATAFFLCYVAVGQISV